MANWNNPTTTSNFATALTEIKDRDVDLAKMFDGTSETNIPSGTKRWNAAAGRFEKWNGSTWEDLQTALTAHLAFNATTPGNPHGTRPSDLTPPAAAQSALDAHAALQNNPHNVTSTQVGAPSTATFNAHVADTTAHPTSAASIGGLLKANNLSDVNSASSARSNIGAAAASDLTSHTGNTSNPHSVTRAQIGAAASGTNGDITSLTACTNIKPSGDMTIGPTTSSQLYFQTGNTVKLQLDNGTSFQPFTHKGVYLGIQTRAFLQCCAAELVNPTGEDVYLSTYNGDYKVRVKLNNSSLFYFESDSGNGRMLPVNNNTSDLGANGQRFAEIWCNSYRPFTGVHSFKNAIPDIDIADAVIMDGEGNLVRASIPNDPRVVGVYMGFEESENLHSIASVGDCEVEGKIKGFKVCNEGGPIKSGTLLVSSSVPGYLMAQHDDVIRAYTMGKAAVDVEFDVNGKAEGVYGFIYAG